jgi:hypothetical protein
MERGRDPIGDRAGGRAYPAAREAAVDEERTVGGGSTSAGGHEHDHEHSHEKDPAEQEALARDLGEELTDLFTRYVRGDIEFADLTFLTYETLQDLYVVASGEYDVEYDDDDSSDDDSSDDDSSDDDAGGEDTDEAADGEAVDSYDEEAGTEEQEDLAQEPAR